MALQKVTSQVRAVRVGNAKVDSENAHVIIVAVGTLILMIITIQILFMDDHHNEGPLAATLNIINAD